MQSIPRLFLSVCVALALSSAAWAQTTLTVHHNANLRKTASTQSNIVGHLTPGDKLEAISENKRFGFWHVRTVTNDEGWVYQTLVHVNDEDDPVPPSFTDTTAADAVSPTWAKPTPVGATLKGSPGSTPCPARGEEGGDYAQNRLKNRIDVPASYHAVTFDAIVSLPRTFGKPDRAEWTDGQLAMIEPFEGIPVSVVGYIERVKKQHGGDGEATNCHFNTINFVDVHVALVKEVGDGEKTSIVVEPTPRFYSKHPSWVFNKLVSLEHSEDPARISGWLMYDANHENHMNKYRQTLWEIHPITKIEIFRNGKWIEY